MKVIIDAITAPALLGECPVWSGAEHKLYWIDIDGRVVHRFDPATGSDESRGLAGRPGSLATTSTPGLLVVAMEHEVIRLDFETGTITPWLQISQAHAANRLNDGRCDPAGRFVVGSMFADTSAGMTSGSLVQIDPTGAVAIMREGVGVANGLAFDSELGRMYFADTPTESVRVFDYDADTGEATNEREFFDYTTIDGKPDGACIDAAGCYWSASVYGWALTRITPDGIVDRRIEVPVEKPSMPAFGGSDLSTLYVTTIGAAGTVPSAPGRDGVQPGALLAIDAGIQGRPEPTFTG